jgi:hypothetical protein
VAYVFKEEDKADECQRGLQYTSINLTSFSVAHLHPPLFLGEDGKLKRDMKKTPSPQFLLINKWRSHYYSIFSD